MASRICASVFDLPLDRRHPATSSRWVSGKRPAGRSRIPSPVSSTTNSVPGPQARAVRILLGKTIWPLVERRVISIGKTLVRLSHEILRFGTLLQLPGFVEKARIRRFGIIGALLDFE